MVAGEQAVGDTCNSFLEIVVHLPYQRFLRHQRLPSVVAPCGVRIIMQLVAN